MTILNGQPTLSKWKSTACKLIQDSLKFWIASCGFRNPGTEFWIPCQWNLGYGLLELNSGFQKPGFLEFQNPGNLIWGEGNEIVERGLPYIHFSFTVYQNGEPAHQLILVEHFGDPTFAPFCVSIF